MPKRLNHFQVHPKKKRKKIPPSSFEKELLELAKSVGFKFYHKTK